MPTRGFPFVPHPLHSCSQDGVILFGDLSIAEELQEPRCQDDMDSRGGGDMFENKDSSVQRREH